MTFTTFGPDDDLRDAFRRRQVANRRARAQSLLDSAREELTTSRDDGAFARAKQLARQSLVFFARSLDWAEDTDEEEEAHHRMDEAGTWVRETFGCRLERNGTRYNQTCPVALAHNRIGFSIGGVATRVCSICGGDLSECDHLPGTAYVVPGGPADLGWCRVCLKDSYDHSTSESYRVSVVAIIRQMTVDEVSLVSKPAHPEARLTAISVPTADLQSALGYEFEPGMEVSCDRCLLPCDGLIRHDIPHG
jgi:hypothetical protein